MTTPPRTWPEGARPTAAQLLEWLRDPGHAAEYGDALLLLDRLLTAAEQADRCLVMDHDNLGRELDHQRRALYTELIRGHRYRLAWMSARRRAPDPNHAADVLESLALTLEEDPDATP